MDQFTSQFLTFGTGLLAVSIFISTFFTRRFVELLRPGWKKQGHELEAKATYLGQAGLWWNDFVLPLIPVLYGSLAAFTNVELLFGPLSKEKLFVRFMWGGGIGWFSGVLYKGVSKALKSKIGVSIDPNASSDPPPPAPPPTA
jgi:hypothetical protein